MTDPMAAEVRASAGTMSADEYNALAAKANTSKYSNVKTEVDGILFDSKAEARRYGELKLLKESGAITHLQLQPKFPIAVNGEKICTYIADFSYHDTESGQWKIEDVKGMVTPIYRLKKKLVKAIHKITITEVK